MSFVYAFVGFAALIVLHEAGHFVAAKAVGMRAERFSLFFGPMWIKRQIGETEYGIGVIPLGGYVKITGMNPDEKFDSPQIAARAYYNQPVWKRLVVIGAGPAVNLVIAFLLAWAFFLSQSHALTSSNGQYVPTRTIAEVIEHSAAANVLKPGDVLVSVDGVKGGAEVLHNQIRTHQCADDAKVNGCEAVTPAKIVVRRDGVLRSFEIRPRYSTVDKEPLVGFAFLDRVAGDGVLYSAGHSVTGLWRAAKATISDFAHIFESKDRKQLSGVVGAAVVTEQQFQNGFSTGIEVLALISLSLGLINLFPFLPLDGGHIFWAIVEKVRGRKISFATMERAGFVGLALIVLLFVVGLSNDIGHITGNGFNVH